MVGIIPRFLTHTSHTMNKAFVKESDHEDDEDGGDGNAPALPAGSKNYMTRKGYEALLRELDQLVRVERPKMVEVVAWAAGNGDRSENGDYIYGKKKLREMDRRIRFLTKRTANAEVVDPERQQGVEQVFFGATVTLYDVDTERDERWQIVGIDEANASEGKISWVSPLARALMRAREGDTIHFQSPSGPRELEVAQIEYLA